VGKPHVEPAEALAEYRRRRDFTRTSEPAGGEAAPAAEHLIFTVQKHAASSLHYDFRLELGGVLKSWAVPKGPSLDPADKRLAVMTEDHPLEYAVFEGTIPEGEYGGGTVMLWDFGWWEPDLAWISEAAHKGRQGAPAMAGEAAAENPPVDLEAALAKGELKLVLHGHKLSGSWALVQMKGRGERNWLLLKHRDGGARPGESIIEKAPDSVLSGLTLEEIAKG
jgi:bifunctional non-homologous end joining protein LigD